jgi:hypothetical protein
MKSVMRFHILWRSPTEKAPRPAREEPESLYPEQIAGILKWHDAGVEAVDFCRISDATFLNWKLKDDGLP